MVSPALSLLLPIFLVSAKSLVFAIEDSASVPASTSTPNTTSNQSTAIQHTKVTQRQSTRERLQYITSGPDVDYYDDEDTTFSTPQPVPLKPCLYDRCEHLSPPCEEIQSKEGGNCLCPGIDGPDVKPDPPNLRQVLSGDQEVTVNWCSPSSTVYSYKILYQGPDSQMEKGPMLNATYRSYSIKTLLPGTQYTVCVVAINNAGESPSDMNDAEEGTEGSWRGPCRILHTNASKMSHVYIGIGVGLGVLAIAMVLLGILLCIKKKRKNRMDVDEKEMGIPNSSYKTGSSDKL